MTILIANVLQDHIALLWSAQKWSEYLYLFNPWIQASNKICCQKNLSKCQCGIFCMFVTFQPMNSRVTQEMFLSKMSMQEPKCSSQGGRASEHWQSYKKCFFSKLSKCRNPNVPVKVEELLNTDSEVNMEEKNIDIKPFESRRNLIKTAILIQRHV